MLRRAGRELLRNQIMMAATRLSIVIDSGADCHRRTQQRVIHVRVQSATAATQFHSLSNDMCSVLCQCVR